MGLRERTDRFDDVLGARRGAGADVQSVLAERLVDELLARAAAGQWRPAYRLLLEQAPIEIDAERMWCPRASAPERLLAGLVLVSAPGVRGAHSMFWLNNALSTARMQGFGERRFEELHALQERAMAELLAGELGAPDPTCHHLPLVAASAFERACARWVAGRVVADPVTYIESQFADKLASVQRQLASRGGTLPGAARSISREDFERVHFEACRPARYAAGRSLSDGLDKLLYRHAFLLDELAALLLAER